jgi:DNA replication protein DnaC
MLIQQTIERLRELGLQGMLKGLDQQLSSADYHALSFDERLGLLIDAEASYRDSKLLSSRLKTAKLRHQACIENLNFRKPRGLDKAAMLQLSSCQWVREHRNVLVTGPTGVGKTYVACALAHKACQQGFKALYERAPRLLNSLAVARADGSYNGLLTKLSKLDVLVIDDFGLQQLNDDMARDLLEIVDDRTDIRSTILASQLPSESWHDTISNPTLADAILDRVVHKSYKLKLKGPSLREPKHNDELKEDRDEQ